MSQLQNGSENRFIDRWRVIRKYQGSIVAIVVTASVLAVVVSLILPKTYKAEAVIVPVSSVKSGGMGALASQLGGVASLAGMGFGAGADDDVTKIVAILKSRTLTENVIERESLMQELFEYEWDAARGAWKSEDLDDQPNLEMGVREMNERVNIMDDQKNNKIEISGEFDDPQLAARIVNAYLDELQKFINTSAFTTAKRNRIFIESQLQQNKRGFLEAGKEINEFYITNHISSVDANIDVRIDGLVGPTVDKASEIEKYANLDLPSVGQIESDINSFVAQKVSLDEQIQQATVIEDVPQQVYLTYLMMRRELLAKMNVLLTTQFEMARIEEAKEELSFEIIDKAVAPFKRYRPKRAQICVLSFFMAIIFALALAFFREYLQGVKMSAR